MINFDIFFQFQKVLCDACGHTGPLYTCDVYQCEAAGDKLKILMGKGSSQYWLDQLHVSFNSRLIYF